MCYDLYNFIKVQIRYFCEKGIRVGNSRIHRYVLIQLLTSDEGPPDIFGGMSAFSMVDPSTTQV